MSHAGVAMELSGYVKQLEEELKHIHMELSLARAGAAALKRMHQSSEKQLVSLVVDLAIEQTRVMALTDLLRDSNEVIKHVQHYYRGSQMSPQDFTDVIAKNEQRLKP